MNEKIWFTYIIVADDDQLYTGITTDINRRWQEHSAGKGARYFRGRQPTYLCYLETYQNRSEASKQEAFIKSLPRAKKILLIESTYSQTLNNLPPTDLPIYVLKTTSL